MSALIEDPKWCRACGFHSLRVMLLGTVLGGWFGAVLHTPTVGLALGYLLGALAIVQLSPMTTQAFGICFGAAMGAPTIGFLVGCGLAFCSPKLVAPR